LCDPRWAQIRVSSPFFGGEPGGFPQYTGSQNIWGPCFLGGPFSRELKIPSPGKKDCENLPKAFLLNRIIGKPEKLDLNYPGKGYIS